MFGIGMPELIIILINSVEKGGKLSGFSRQLGRYYLNKNITNN